MLEATFLAYDSLSRIDSNYLPDISINKSESSSPISKIKSNFKSAKRANSLRQKNDVELKLDDLKILEPSRQFETFRVKYFFEEMVIPINQFDVEAEHIAELRSTVRLLSRRLDDRPYDQRALVKLANAYYDLKDYISASIMILKVFKSGAVSGNLQIKLARCLMHRWFVDGKKNKSAIMSAMKYYRLGLQDPAVASPTLCTPALYMELAVVQLRLGQHQSALNVLGACLVLTRTLPDEVDPPPWKQSWSSICQYGIALIMFALGNIEDALQVYQRLLLLPLYIEVEPDPESPHLHPPLLPLRISGLLVQIEAARCFELLGQTPIAAALYVETWSRLNKMKNSTTSTSTTTPPVNNNSNSGNNNNNNTSRANSQKDSTVINASIIPIEKEDLRYGAKDMKQWKGDPAVLWKLGQRFQEEGNLSFAADVYLQCWERSLALGNWNRLSNEIQSRAIEALLRRAECLSEFSMYEEAEKYAHIAVSALPEYDAVAIARASLCCRNTSTTSTTTITTNLPEQEMKDQIIGEGKKVLQAVSLMQNAIRAFRLRQRGQRQVKRHNAAITINATLRMALTRNRYAGDFLMSAPIMPNPPLPPVLNRCVFRGLLKSGREQLSLWLQLVYVTATQLQEAVRAWLTRRRKQAFWKGMKLLQRFYRGQRCRLALRSLIQDIQVWLDFESDSNDRNLDVTFRESVLSLPWDSIKSLSCGGRSICGSGGELDKLAGSDSPSPTTVKSKLLPVTPTLLPQRFTSKIIRSSCESTPSTTTTTTTTTTIALPSSTLDSVDDPIDAGNGKGIGGEGNNAAYNVHTSSKKKHEIVATVNRRKSTHASSSTSPTKPSKQLPHSTASSHHVTKLQKEEQKVADGEDAMTTSTSTVREGEVLCLLNRAGAKLAVNSEYMNDVDQRQLWIPFGITPDRALTSLLQGSVLAVTSPSLRSFDCLRLWRIATAKPQCWRNIRSLTIDGTNIGPSGVRAILRIGITHMESVTFTNCGLTHHFGPLIGKMLLPDETRLIHLTQLYLDTQPRIGERGAERLFRYLQRSRTIKRLRLKSCGLGEKAAAAAARYVAISECLEDLELPENFLDFSCCLCLLRAVGQRGGRGSLRSVRLESQRPELTDQEVLLLLTEGAKLGVRMYANKPVPPADTSDSTDIPDIGTSPRFGPKRLAEVEQRLEKSLGEDQFSLETRRLKAMLDEMTVEGSLHKAKEIRFFKTVYI